MKKLFLSLLPIALLLSGCHVAPTPPAPVGTLKIDTTTVPPATQGQSYSTPLVSEGGTPPITWSGGSGLPPGVGVVPAGYVTTSGLPLSAAVGAYPFSIAATDSATAPNNQQTATQSLTLQVNPATLVITSSGTLTAGQQGVAYSTTFVATGGTGADTWSVATGSTLPTGMSLTAAGALTGSPAAYGQYTFTIQAKDSGSPAQTATLACSWTVNPATLAITTTSLPPATAGVAYSVQLTATGGVTPYTWSITSGTLPTGIALSSSGLLSGTPTATGTFSLVIQVQDSGTTFSGKQNAQVHTVDISWVAPVSSPTPVTNFNVYAEVAPATSGKKVGQVPVTQTVYTDLEEESLKVTYWVTSYNSTLNLESVPSNTVTTTIPVSVASPDGLSPTITSVQTTT